MPAYTILIMKRNETDRRPLTIHISQTAFWAVIGLALALPIMGFGLSVGWIAPAWLKLDMSSMENRVKMADQVMLENKQLKQEMDDLKAQMDGERATYAGNETKITMAETARAEATQKLTQLEADMIALKRSVATYEQLLKPKLERELVQCVNLDARFDSGKVTYSTNFAKLTQSLKLPAKMNARVRVVVGDNAMAMQAGGAKDLQVTHVIEAAKNLGLKGVLPVIIPPDTTRLPDVKVFDENQKPVGYCWKTF